MKLVQNCSLLIILFIAASSYAQTASQSQLYDVCGNPKLECKTSGGSDDADLPIKVTGKLEWMGEYKSKAFYAVIVQSRKVIAASGPEDECGGHHPCRTEPATVIFPFKPRLFECFRLLLF
jgi:hypothetical protein